MQKLVSRVEYMDALRAVLMLLGIIIHTSQIYNPEKSWLIYSMEGHFIFEIVIDAISSFRMPAFFIVSGYFSFLLLKKLSFRDFLIGRFERLIVPLAIGVLTLNIPIALLLSQLDLMKFELGPFLVGGAWRQHLWFLGTLFIYSVLLTVLFMFNWVNLIFSSMNRLSNLLSLGFFVVLLPSVHVFILSLNKLGVPIYSVWYGFSIYELLYYLPFFAFGAYLRFDSSALERFSSISGLLIVLCGYVGVAIIKFIGSSYWSEAVDSAFFIYTKTLLAWALSIVCFFVFKRFFSRESELVKRLANASYSIYLLHQPVIVLLGLSAINVGLTPFFGFVLIVALTFIITFFIHDKFIKRFAVVEYLLNGKRA